MKRILLTTLVIGLIGLVQAQDYLPNKEEIERFYTTKTYVVLDDNPLSEYNLVIKHFIEQEWKLTPYEIIPATAFEEKRFDPKSSFIFLNKVRFEKDKTGARYRFLSVVLGGPEKIVSNMPDLCPVPISYYGVEEESYIYKLPVILRFVQNHIELIRKDPSIVALNMFKYYNDNMSDIKGKTLFLLKEELAPDCNTEAKIKKIYSHPFKIVTKDEIIKVIEARDSNYVFLHKVGPEGSREQARCYKMLVGAGDARFYYFNYHMIKDDVPDALLAKDLKKLGKK